MKKALTIFLMLMILTGTIHWAVRIILGYPLNDLQTVGAATACLGMGVAVCNDLLEWGWPR